MRRAALVLAALCVSLLPLSVSAHGAGVTFSKQVDQYYIDVDYELPTVVAGDMVVAGQWPAIRGSQRAHRNTAVPKGVRLPEHRFFARLTAMNFGGPLPTRVDHPTKRRV